MECFYYKDNFNGNTKTLRLGAKGEEYIKSKNISNLKNEIIPIYKKQKNCFDEIVYVVGENALFDFCKNYKEYIFKNEIYNTESAEKVEELVRKYIQVFRKQRDPNFRNKVLKYFDYTCIVCGCKEVNMLQAAHIISVAHKGSDDISNGYCLCANHHLLFDAGKLNIDIENGIYNYTDDISDPWKKEGEKRNFKLFLPNDKE